MERARGAKGQFVKAERTAEPVEDEGGWTDVAPGKAPRPANCRVYTRARFAEALPGLMQTLIREAKRGSVAHLKLLVVICGLDQGPVKPAGRKRKVKDLEQILMEDWKREDEREAAVEKAGSLWNGDEDVAD
jgi:hypothetical protein